MLIKEYNTNEFKSIEAFDVGLDALKGKPVVAIAEENCVSRQHVYNQKSKMEDQIGEIRNKITGDRGKEIRIDDKWIKRAVIWLALDCCSCLEGIQSFIEKMIGIHISIGTISGILKEASERAKLFDETVPLSGIKTGANDEIFQCNQPVLTGIDPKTTYIYLMTATDDRTGQTWETAFGKAKNAGLSLEKSVNDGGSGLNKGIPQAFPGIQIQADVFHAEHDIGKAIGALERKALHAIKEEAMLEEKLLSTEKTRKGTWEKYEALEAETKETVRIYDLAYILYTWLRELFCVTGYSPTETKALIEYILNELEQLSEAKSLKKGVSFIRQHIDQLLLFARLVEEQVMKLTELGIARSTCELMLLQLRYSHDSAEYNQIEAEIGESLGSRYAEIRGLFYDIRADAVRASSMVENINGRLRVYMNMKRIIPNNFLYLLKVYFNTKKYRRSRCSERVGKSPLDLLTGKTNPDMLELLGY